MAEFERGDIVVYVHPEAPADGRGALAIVERIRDNYVDVQWVSITKYFLEKDFSEDPESGWSTFWEPQSFEKVGHIDLPE